MIPDLTNPVTAGILSGAVVLGFQVLLAKTSRYLKEVRSRQDVRRLLALEQSPNAARIAWAEGRKAA